MDFWIKSEFVLLVSRLRVLIAASGITAAGVLVLTEALGIDPPCGGSSGCTRVQNSAMAEIVGVRTAQIGLAAWLVLFFLVAARHLGRIDRRIDATVTYGLTALGAMVSLWLTRYSVVEVGATCAWCLVSGFAMCASFALCALSQTLPAGEISPNGERRRVWAIGAMAFIAIGGFVTFAAREDDLPFDVAATTPLRESLVADSHPVLGFPSKGRPTVIVFGDLLCPATRHAWIALRAKVDARQADIRWRQYSAHRGDAELTTGALAETAARQGRLPDLLDAVADSKRYAVGEIESAMAHLALPDSPDASATRRTQDDWALARRMGLKRTPTFVLIAPGRPPVALSTSKAIQALANL